MTEPTKTAGARTAANQNPEAAAKAVEQMFSSIAPKYDLLNHVLSMNVDRWWWWRTARRFRALLQEPENAVLDLCCGTGDMTFALYKQSGGKGARVTGADFSRAMLERARLKDAHKRIEWFEADALHLPFADASFNLVTSAFGFRNLADYDAGLREISRVLRPKGEIGILDFGEPKGLIGRFYRFYFRNVLPRVGTMISGIKGPYAYLPASVARFPEPPEMLDRMKAAGFREVSYTPYTFGIAGLYWGRK
ncbi:MAG TPA: bifunctional demethylmenaquinone methyltransferase/2-methoxy-6-polyprenyl-1,4-benzoquinol methylase UbiE [candidate division Zixibacteria bacterium]|nr:bifunctional demethylmenaquinone methyltransferase/2-methoxy-6-polyprenyl-1,4-benzoquinol methylase UbiE [candidate division Zixibacteria bacterium]